VKRHLARLKAWAKRDKVQQTFAIGLVALGASSLRFLLEDHDKRLRDLEERGLVPLDDLATVGDLAKLEGRVNELAGNAEGTP
jgi:hypothetical protein